MRDYLPDYEARRIADKIGQAMTEVAQLVNFLEEAGFDVEFGFTEEVYQKISEDKLTRRRSPYVTVSRRL